MRLLEIRRGQPLAEDAEDLSGILYVLFSVDGVRAGLSLQVPDSWDAWTRAEKIAWVKEGVLAHLETMNYMMPGVVFPDLNAAESAKADFESLPGWATWTGAEAADWIESNVIDLATAKIAMKRMARAIVHLRDVVIER